MWRAGGVQEIWDRGQKSFPKKLGQFWHVRPYVYTPVHTRPGQFWHLRLFMYVHIHQRFAGLFQIIKYMHVYIYTQMYIVHCLDSFDIYAAGRLWVWRRWSQTGQRAISRGRSRDNALLCSVVICSVSLLLSVFGCSCFIFFILWVYVNITMWSRHHALCVFLRYLHWIIVL